MPDDLLRRLKAVFLLSCALGIVALTGWGAFIYELSAAHRISDQMADLVGERNALKAQRDEALQKLEQLQQPPANIAQIEERLKAAGTEYNRLWGLAKAKRLEAAEGVDSVPTGSIRKGQSVNRTR